MEVKHPIKKSRKSEKFVSAHQKRSGNGSKRFEHRQKDQNNIPDRSLSPQQTHQNLDRHFLGKFQVSQLSLKSFDVVPNSLNSV